MRTNLALVIALLGASSCKKVDKTTGTGSAAVTGSAGSDSGSGSAVGSGSAAAGAGSAVASAAPCFDREGELQSFTADDKTATFCVKSGETAPHCATMDLATGATTEVKEPAAVKVAEAFEYKQDPKAVQACKGATCVKLDLPKLPPKQGDGTAPTYAIHASADGKLLLATGNEVKGVVVLDAVTGKKQKTIAVQENPEDGCLADAQFLGDAIYAVVTVCAGPGAEGRLFHLDGKPFGKVDKVNVYSSTPVHLDGDQWAFAEANGAGYEVVDVKTGKEVQTVAGVTRPDDCVDCEVFAGSPMFVNPLIKTPNGKLVEIGASGISTIDSKTHKTEKTHKIMPCPAPKVP